MSRVSSNNRIHVAEPNSGIQSARLRDEHPQSQQRGREEQGFSSETFLLLEERNHELELEMKILKRKTQDLKPDFLLLAILLNA